MAEEPRELEPVDEDEVVWHVAEDGTEYFLDDDGVRWELADDGYAYAVGEVDVRAGDAVLDDAGESGGEVEGDDDAVRDGEDAEATRVIRLPADEAAEPTREVASLSVVGRRSAGATPSPPPAAEDGDLLLLEDLRSGYGKLPVLHGVDFGIRRGETAVLLGLNGAGKTTTALNVCGAVETWGGRITFDGQDVTRWSTRQAVASGIVMVPEGRRVFPELTAERNLQVGAWSQRASDDWFEAQRDRVFDYFPRLRERRQQLAGTLSGGEQQMLAIGRGLMANPRLLIIDEASMGLAPVIVHDVFEIVSHINDDGVTVLMIESNVGSLDVADLGLVMEQGRIIRRLRGEELDDRSLVSEVLMG